MPININYQNIERGVVLMETSDQLIELLVRVGPVSRPPSPECEARRQRNFTCHTREIVKSALVIVSVAEEVQILTLSRWTRCDPRPAAALSLREGEIVGVKKLARAVVHDGPAITRDQPWFQLHIRALDPVQGAGGTEQIAGISHSRPPYDLFSVQAESDAEIVRGKFSVCVSRGVDQLQRARLNRRAPPIGRGFVREFRDGKPAIQKDQRGVVFKLAICSPLHADQLRPQNGEARGA